MTDQSMHTQDTTIMEDDEEGIHHAGVSCVTLWGVSTVYEEKQTNNNEAPFRVHVSFLRKFGLENVGPGISIFVNPPKEEKEEETPEKGAGLVANMWRKQKQYAIYRRPKKRMEEKEGRERDYQEEKIEGDLFFERSNRTEATLSTEAPVTSLFFSTSVLNTFSSSSPSPLLLATMDYNGGISVLDCTSISLYAVHDEIGATKAASATIAAADSIKSFTKNRGKQEREEKEEDDDLPPTNAMEMVLLHPRERMLLLHNQFALSRKKKNNRIMLSPLKMDPVIHATWWNTVSIARDSENSEIKKIQEDFPQLPLLATITSCGTFTLWSFQYHHYPHIIFQTSIVEQQRRHRINGFHDKNLEVSAEQTAIFSSMIHNGSSLPFLYRLQKASTQSHSPSSSLIMCAIEKVEPKTLISSLIQQHQYAEALSMASQFNYQDHAAEDEKGILDCCYKHLWSVNCDLDMLKSIQDDGYVIDIALGLENQNQKENRELSKIRDIWGEGLKRCRKVMQEKRGEDITLASYDYEKHDKNDSVIQCVASKLQSGIIRLGTYLLISNRIQGSANARKFDFFTTFMHLSIKDLAIAVGKRGDVDALTMLLIRHADELRFNEVRMEILNVLPLGLAIELRFIRHLLPCCGWSNGKIQGGAECDSLFVLDPPCGETKRGKEPSISLLRLVDLAYLIRDVCCGIVESSIFSGFGTGRSKLALFTDDLDEAEVLLRASSFSHNYNSETDETETTSSLKTIMKDVAGWYYHRAIALHKFTGQLLSVMELCTLGLDRLGVGLQQQTEMNGYSSFENLYSLRAQAFHLNQLLMSGILPAALQSTTYSRNLSLNEECTLEHFESLGFEGFISLILGASENKTDVTNDAHEIVSRYQRYLRPMIDENSLYYMSCWKKGSCGAVEEEDDNLHSSLERCIIKFCLKRVRNVASTVNGRAAMLSSPELQSALSLCCMFANMSRTTLERADRIIQTPNMLTEFVIDAIVMASGGGGSTSFSVLERFWDLYECLPLRVPSLEEKDKTFLAYQQQIDRLYVYLIILDILSHWCQYGSSKELSFPIDLEAINLCAENSKLNDVSRQKDQVCDEEETIPCTRFVALGCKVIAAASGGFCRRIQLLSKLPPEQHPKQQHDLVLDFVTDMSGLDQKCFCSSLDINSILEVHLLLPLLYQHSFQALKMILQECPAWFDCNVVESYILAFVREAALLERPSLSPASQGVNTDRAESIKNAIDCQDILGPCFPNLHSEFDAIRRYLDAAHFIQNVLHCANDSTLLEPTVLDSTPPMQIIELVLSENQHSMVLGCADWSKPEFAAKANFDIHCHFAPKDASTPQENSSYVETQNLPPPPGGYVLQLGGILGLQSEYEQFIVMNLMVRCASNHEWYGVAAALCALLLREAQAKSMIAEDSGSARNLILMKSVADVVSAESYLDCRMRHELCVTSLRLFSSTNSCLPIDTILHFFPILESQTSPYCYTGQENRPNDALNKSDDCSSARESEIHEGGAQTGEFLVFRAAGIVARQAKTIVNHVKKSTTASHSLEILQDLYQEHGMEIHGKYSQTPASLFADVCKLLPSLRANLKREAIEGLSTGPKTVSTEATLQALANLVLLWCVSESCMVRAGPVTDLSVVRNVREMLHMGAAFLLEMQDIPHAQSILVDLQNKLEVDASSALERLAQTAQPCSVVPDENIVRQLCGRGYSINGARRSAAMTNNENFSAALVWAIAHFTDEGFDSPLIYVKGTNNSSNGGFIDQKLMQLVRQTLRQVQRTIDGNEQQISSLPDQGLNIEQINSNPSNSHLTKVTQGKSFVAQKPNAALPPVSTPTQERNNKPQQTHPPPPPPLRQESKGKLLQQAPQIGSIHSQSRNPPSVPNPSHSMSESNCNVPSPPLDPKQESQLNKVPSQEKPKPTAHPPLPKLPANKGAAPLIESSLQQLAQNSLNVPLPPKTTSQHTSAVPPPPPRAQPPPPPPRAQPAPPRAQPTPPRAPPPLPVQPGSLQTTTYSPGPPPYTFTRGLIASPLSGASLSSFEQSVSSRGIETSASSRASLREKGRIARAETKIKSKRLTVDERRKLALEGRNILEEARKARSVNIPPATVMLPRGSNTSREKIFSDADKGHKETTCDRGEEKTAKPKHAKEAVPAKVAQQDHTHLRGSNPINGTGPEKLGNTTTNGESSGRNLDGKDSLVADEGSSGKVLTNHKRTENLRVNETIAESLRNETQNGDSGGWDFDDEDSIVFDEETNGKVLTVDERSETLGGISRGSGSVVSNGCDFNNNETVLTNIDEKTEKVSHESENASDGWDFDDF